MKKIKILLICMLSILVSGCNNIKQSIDGIEFYDIALKAEYKPYDIVGEYPYAESAYFINKGITKVTFVEGKKQYDVEGVFIDECRNLLESLEDGKYKQQVSNGDNWTSLAVTTDDNYYYIVWVDDTYLYVETSIKQKSALEELIEELGY